MTLTPLEHTALIAAGAGLGAKILAGTQLWWIVLGAGLLIAIGSFVYRKGWVTPPAGK